MAALPPRWVRVGKLGHRKNELERIIRGRYVLNSITAEMKGRAAERNSDTGEIWFSISVWAEFSLPCSCPHEVPKQSLAQDSRSSGSDSLITRGSSQHSNPIPSRCAAPAVAALRGGAFSRLRCFLGQGLAEPRVGHSYRFVLLALELEWLFNYCHPQYLARSFTVYALCGKVL